MKEGGGSSLCLIGVCQPVFPTAMSKHVDFLAIFSLAVLVENTTIYYYSGASGRRDVRCKQESPEKTPEISLLYIYQVYMFPLSEGNGVARYRARRGKPGA